MALKLEPPAALTRSQRAVFRRISTDLQARGIDPGARRELIADYVMLEDRLAGLRLDASMTEGSARMAAVRALNTASSERRRLYQALYAGAAKREPPPTRAEIAERASAVSDSAADAAWLAFFGRRTDLSDDERAKQEAELKARFGDPSWPVLLTPVRDYPRGR